VAHRGNHSKPITGVRHVQVRDEHLEGLGSDEFQGFCHTGGRDYVKAFAFKGRSHHSANCFVVIHQQDSVRNARFGLGHIPPPLLSFVKHDEYDLVSLPEMYQTDQFLRLLAAKPDLGLFG
jgi:hypothetical protein